MQSDTFGRIRIVISVSPGSIWFKSMYQ